MVGRRGVHDGMSMYYLMYLVGKVFWYGVLLLLLQPFLFLFSDKRDTGSWPIFWSVRHMHTYWNMLDHRERRGPVAK